MGSRILERRRVDEELMTRSQASLCVLAMSLRIVHSKRVAIELSYT